MNESPVESVEDEDHRPRSSKGFAKYLATKLGGTAISMLLIVIFGFLMFRVIPGNAALTMTRGRRVSAHQIEMLRHEYGLDLTFWQQFKKYIFGLFKGDLGVSFTYHEPVSSLIKTYLGPTLLLTGTASVLAITLGLWLGQRAAWRRGSLFDRFHSGLALVLWSVPTFWLGLILLVVFGGILNVLPTVGMQTTGVDYTALKHVLDIAEHLVLPAITMAGVMYAQYLLIMRASLLEEMTGDYLLTAKAKGLRDSKVRTRHAVPNALLPTVTIVFLQIGVLISGTVMVEAVFGWPGLGYLTYQALAAPDLPLLQGTFVVFSAMVVMFNLLADLLYRFLDPRVRAA